MELSLTIILGLVFGSFLNVVIHRLPRNRSIVKPRSRCPKCSKQLAWYDNIPLLSYIALRGKCRKCGVRISLRYPMVELLTAALFVAAKTRFGWSPTLWLAHWPFVAAMVAITFIDIDHRIIPDELSLGGLALGLITALWSPDFLWWPSFIGAAGGFTIFFGMAWLYERFSGKAGLGGGDVKFLAMIGAWTGLQGVFTTILISSVLGSLFGIAWGLSRKNKKVLGVSIPYGPFLVIGALYYYFLGEILWSPFMTQT